MPFGLIDVDKHNKGLSDRAKTLWIRVANDVLNRCEEKGGDNCDASAIRQANAVVAREFTDAQWADIEKYAQVQTFNIDGVEIFSTGLWNGDNYTEQDLDDMVSAFHEVGFTPPLKLGHDDNQPISGVKDGAPAIGWVGTIRREGQKLLADMKEIPQKVYDALKRGNYRTVSSEVYWDYSGGDRVFNRVLKAVALLGADIPAVTSLESIANLYTQEERDEKVKIYDMAVKDSDIDKGEGSQVKTKINKEDIKMDEMEKVKKELADERASKEALETQVAEFTKKDEEKDGQLKEAEGELAKERATRKADSVKTFIKEQKDAGKVLPAFEGKLEAILVGASDEKVHKFSNDGKEETLSQRELIEGFVTALPKIVEFAEMAKDGGGEAFTGDYTDAGEEIDKRVKAYMAKNTEVKDYSVAQAAVLDADSVLKDKYTGGK